MAETTGPGWERGEVNVRLGRRRKARLMEVAKGLAPGATPTDAIDHAIALALEPRYEPADQSAELQDAMEALASSHRADNDRTQHAIKALAASVESLRSLISTVAAADDC